jgi:hypothetical protein
LQPHPNQFYSFHWLFWTSKLQDTLESCMNRCFSTGDALAEAKEADPGSMVWNCWVLPPDLNPLLHWWSSHLPLLLGDLCAFVQEWGGYPNILILNPWENAWISGYSLNLQTNPSNSQRNIHPETCRYGGSPVIQRGKSTNCRAEFPVTSRISRPRLFGGPRSKSNIGRKRHQTGTRKGHWNGPKMAITWWKNHGTPVECGVFLAIFGLEMKDKLSDQT